LLLDAAAALEGVTGGSLVVEAVNVDADLNATVDAVE
jgi:hypothetical protein